MHILFIVIDFQEEPDDPNLSAEDIKGRASFWVKRCQMGAITVFTLWVIWIILAQVLRRYLPVRLYMVNADDAELTGW